MSDTHGTLTERPTADEQVAQRTRELYAQYAEATGKTPTRRRNPRKRSRTAMRGGRPSETPTPDHDEIAFRAYMLFEQAGRPPGRDVEFWLEAERQLTIDPDA